MNALKNYMEIFNRIENTLRKESSFSHEDFEKAFEWYRNCNYKNMSDDEIYWTMVCVVFYSGFRAKTVSERLQSLEKYFKDYQKVKGYTQAEVAQIIDDPNTIHNKRKIHGCIENAKKFDEIVKEHGSFGAYLASFGDPKDVSTVHLLSNDLRERKRFRYFGRITVNHFLTDLGFNVLKPDRVICRIFSRLGFVEDREDLQGVIAVGRMIAEATAQPIRYVDIIFVKYGQEGEDEYFGLKDGICLEDKPKCHKCEVTTYCRHYQKATLGI
jgi:DNA-3-methyladenine glycosylase I